MTGFGQRFAPGTGSNKTVVFEIDGREFRLSIIHDGEGASLRVSDGRRLEITAGSWVALAAAIRQLFPAQAGPGVGAVDRMPAVALPMERHIDRPADRAGRPPPRLPALARVGKAWTAEEDERLRREFRNGMSVPRLARLLLRTVAGVQLRLGRHGLMDPPRWGPLDGSSPAPTGPGVRPIAAARDTRPGPSATFEGFGPASSHGRNGAIAGPLPSPAARQPRAMPDEPQSGPAGH